MSQIIKIISNTRSLLILVAVLLLGFFSMFPVERNTQLAIFGIVIILTGIPHGAMDYFLEQQNQINKSNHFSTPIFFLFYFFSMIAYSIVWHFFPIISLVIFIIFTAFHFGEIDTYSLHDSKFLKIFSPVFGFFTILYVISGHIEETAGIINFLTDYYWEEGILIKIGEGIFKASIIGIFASFILLLMFNIENKKLVLIFMSQMVVVLGIVYLLPFYLSFALYFGIWHSFLSFHIIYKHLRLKNMLQEWRPAIVKMLPYSLAAIMFIGVVVMFFWSFELKQIIGSIFVGISIISLPHQQIFSRTIRQMVEYKY